jgi:hypothetical protein
LEVHQDQGGIAPLDTAAPETTETRDITFEEAFADAESREKYEKTHERLYLDVVVDAHECLRDARVILVDTPLWLLQPGPAPVLRHIAITYIQHAALHVINALTDNDPRALTLNKLKALFLGTCDPAKKAELGRQLRAGFRAHKFTSLRQRAGDLRDKSLAHYDEEYATNPALRASIGMTLKEVEALRGKAEGLLHVLKPGHGLGFDVHTISPKHNMAYVVLQLMRDSPKLTMPDREHRMVFNAMTRDWPGEQRKIFNDWRVKTGMEALDFDNLPE